MKYMSQNGKNFWKLLMLKKSVPDWHDKLQSAHNYSDDGTTAQETTQELNAREEWMLLSDVVPGLFVTTDQPEQIVNTHYNWQSDRLRDVRAQKFPRTDFF